MGVASGWCTHSTVRARDGCVCGCMCLCVDAECADGGACDVCVEAEVLVCVRADSDSGTQCSVVGALDNSDVGCVLVVCVWCSCMTCRLHWRAAAVARCRRVCRAVVLCRCAAHSRDSRSLCSSVQWRSSWLAVASIV
jgi:hypothetical protein